MAAQTGGAGGGLLDAILGEVTRPGPRCGVARLTARLDPGLAAEFRTALADPDTYPAAAIARAMQARGHHVSQGTIQYHRRGECSCAR